MKIAPTPVAIDLTYGLEFVKLFAKKERDTWSPISLVMLRLADMYGPYPSCANVYAFADLRMRFANAGSVASASVNGWTLPSRSMYDTGYTAVNEFPSWILPPVGVFPVSVTVKA